MITALFDISGASATLAHLNLDRNWRNIRTISSHNHTGHKAYALGNLSVNGVGLPTQVFFDWFGGGEARLTSLGPDFRQDDGDVDTYGDQYMGRRPGGVYRRPAPNS
ncbi:hypothetical protein [Herbaspirillum sp. alder98]|uniref:hypothetical protein n=1 Tax=Herbaspirillum sp. alder98 TaxID=2913096 RepID=UPI001CD8F1CF|nr:hypothetical protein [Herbaspirillum sp. alder98]MCA1323684.1 hypothetical protein [Herbaspirillum sp. alder98]